MFSMSPATTTDKVNDYEIVLLEREYIGFANMSSIQDYRFFMVDMASELQIDVTRFPNQGFPKFYVKIMDSTSGGLPPRRNNFHYESETDPETKGNQKLSLDSNQRTARFPLCASYYSSLQPDGIQRCLVAISVNC